MKSKTLHQILVSNADSPSKCDQIDALMKYQPKLAKEQLFEVDKEGLTPLTKAMWTGEYAIATQLVQDIEYFSTDEGSRILQGLEFVDEFQRNCDSWQELAAVLQRRGVYLDDPDTTLAFSLNKVKLTETMHSEHSFSSKTTASMESDGEEATEPKDKGKKGLKAIGAKFKAIFN